MRAIVARPPGEGPFRAVISFPHVGGLTETMRIMARRVADGGYLCLVPDLYHRLGTLVIDPQSENEAVVAIRKIAAASVTEAGAMDDAGAAFAFLAGRPDARGPEVATLGYGRGGSLALRAAAAFPDRVVAAASVLGFGFAPQGREAAIASFAPVRASLYGAFAECDEIIPASEPELLASIVRPLALDAKIVVHPGARHPYVFPDRAVHDAAAARRDFDAIFAMFERRFGASPRKDG
jgi:carboxymethylenebutenolidase